ncbi:MAG: EMC3/TMCO1 family protein [Candidatus Micrarchaeota archaeon]
MYFGIDTVYIVAAIGVVYSLASRFLMNKLVDRNKAKEMQKEMKALQKELSEASKSGNSKRVEEVNRKYEKFMPKMLTTQFSQMKPLIIIIPALAIIMPILKDTFVGFEITLPFSLPIFIQNFENFPNWRDTFGPVGWFWITVILAGIGIYLITTIYTKVKQKFLSPASASGKNNDEKNENKESGNKTEKNSDEKNGEKGGKEKNNGEKSENPPEKNTGEKNENKSEIKDDNAKSGENIDGEKENKN